MQLHEKRSLDVRALGDLSGFPALCELRFDLCEVTMCQSMLGAVRHASLVRLCFTVAHPAPECALMVLQLSQALRCLKRGSVLMIIDCDRLGSHAVRNTQGRAPCQNFKAAL